MVLCLRVCKGGTSGVLRKVGGTSVCIVNRVCVRRSRVQWRGSRKVGCATSELCAAVGIYVWGSSRVPMGYRVGKRCASSSRCGVLKRRQKR